MGLTWEVAAQDGKHALVEILAGEQTCIPHQSEAVTYQALTWLDALSSARTDWGLNDQKYLFVSDGENVFQLNYEQRK